MRIKEILTGDVRTVSEEEGRAKIARGLAVLAREESPVETAAVTPVVERAQKQRPKK